MVKQSEVIAELEETLGFTRESNPEAFARAVEQLKDEKLTQRLAEATVVNEETGEVLSLSTYVERLMHDASQAGVSITDTVSAVKELTERMVPLPQAFPGLDEAQLETLQRQILQHCRSGNKGHRLADTAPIYFTPEYSGLIAIQSPKTGEVVVVWREFVENVPLSRGTGTYPTFEITGIARNIDEDEARSMLNDAMEAKRALWADKTDGWGWAPPAADDAESPF